MKKIVYYIRLTDNFLISSILFLMFAGFLLILCVYRPEKSVGIAASISFILFAVTTGLSIKFLRKKEALLSERYHTDPSTAYGDFENELERM